MASTIIKRRQEAALIPGRYFSILIPKSKQLKLYFRKEYLQSCLGLFINNNNFSYGPGRGRFYRFQIVTGTGFWKYLGAWHPTHHPNLRPWLYFWWIGENNSSWPFSSGQISYCSFHWLGIWRLQCVMSWSSLVVSFIVRFQTNCWCCRKTITESELWPAKN